MWWVASTIQIQDKLAFRKASVVPLLTDPTKNWLVVVNPDGSKILPWWPWGDTTARHFNWDALAVKKTIGSTTNFGIGLITNNVERITINADWTLLLPYYTTNGFIKTSGWTGALSIQTSLTETDLSLSNITTNNASVTQHWFLPTLSNVTTQFLRWDGSWAIPWTATAPNAYSLNGFTGTTLTVTHNFGAYPLIQVIDSNGAVVIPLSIVNNSVNDFTVTFSASWTYNIIATLGAPQLNTFVTTANDYAMLAWDYIIEETGAGKTVTLLTAVGRAGKIVVVKNASAWAIYATGTGGQTLEWVATVTIPAGNAYDFYSNGTVRKAK